VNAASRQTTVSARSTKVTAPSRRGTRTASIGWVNASVTMQPAPGDLSRTSAKTRPLASYTPSTVIE
jgi:hypothetical protein